MNPDDEIKEMLRDLIWLNALIATELVQITENTSQILRKVSSAEACIAEHAPAGDGVDIADRQARDDPPAAYQKHQ